MSTIEKLNRLFPKRIVVPTSIAEIPSDKELVYILTCNDRALVVGRGKKVRARVIFDTKDRITRVHFKAMYVRLHHLLENRPCFCRYIIVCHNQKESRLIEKTIHRKIGGNKPKIPIRISKRLFFGIRDDSQAWAFLKTAIVSSYDGLSDLRKWRNSQIINDASWAKISAVLELDDSFLNKRAIRS